MQCDQRYNRKVSEKCKDSSYWEKHYRRKYTGQDCSHFYTVSIATSIDNKKVIDFSFHNNFDYIIIKYVASYT